jgi:hypothetical protein
MSDWTGQGTAAPETAPSVGGGALSAVILADLEVFFNEFAVDAVYIPATGPVATIKVIFDMDDGTLLGMSGFRYHCLAKTADVLNAVPNETLVIEGVTYKIKDPPHHTSDGTSEIELTID